MTNLNMTIADLVGSASFVIATFSLLIASLAVVLTFWIHHRTKTAEVEAKKLELSYKLLVASAGGGDALRDPKLTSSMQTQFAAIAALREYPEYVDSYRVMLEVRRKHDEKDKSYGEEELLDALERTITEIDSRNR
jgi:hypothetical protein